MNGSDAFVTLKGGLTLPVAAIRVALDLESRGLHLCADGDSLTVGPRERLTDQDRQAIRRWKFHLLEIAGYSERQAKETIQ